MLLRREDIEEAMRRPIKHRLVIAPLLDHDRQLGAASVDLRLGTEFMLLRRRLASGIDARFAARPLEEDAAEEFGDGLSSEAIKSQSQPGDAVTGLSPDDLYERVTVEFGRELWLHPNQFVLGATLEYIRLPPDLGAYVIGRSTWGRVGLLVATAIMVQPGFTGCLTLELVNEGDSPVALYPGLRVAQLAVHSMDGETAFAYGREKGDKYDFTISPGPARFTKESDEIAHVIAAGEALRRIGEVVP